MKTEKVIENILDAADIAKTGIELASNIERCCDPNDKKESIVDIVGNSIMFCLKIGSFANRIFRENEFNQQMNSSLSMLGKSIDTRNLFYIETYNVFQNITQERYIQIMADYDKCVKSEFSSDVRVMEFWNVITAQSNSSISECDFDYGLAQIMTFDCATIRQNYTQFSPLHIEHVVIPEYRSFMSQSFELIKSELILCGKIICNLQKDNSINSRQ